MSLVGKTAVVPPRQPGNVGNGRRAHADHTRAPRSTTHENVS